jgi:hypothetical protein
MYKIRSIFLIVLCLFILFKGPSYAAEISTSSAAPSDVNYFLAYPGILPDNPFYFLKAIRDKSVSFLINDNIKRAEFNLLTSDKRMFAGQILVEKDKTELGLVTISKSNNYFHNAISAVQEADVQGAKTQDVYQKMDMSIQKHIELMEKYGRYFKKEEKDLYSFERKRMQEMKEMVDKELSKIEKK